MSNFDSIQSGVEEHYTRGDLATAIFDALTAAGIDPVKLRPEDLSPVDEFHIRGRHATLELARSARLNETMHILDVGSGVGGPSRCLAMEFGCRVTGLDLTAEYCRVARILADRLGIGNLVSYKQGDALDMPFDDDSFDVVWTQHTAMNISDKPKLYAEIGRILKPGGKLAIYDVLVGNGGPVRFPVPWAREPSISFLVSPEEMRMLLREEGFEILSWRDTTGLGREWFRAVRQKRQDRGPYPLGIHLLLGPDFQDMTRNLVRNLEEKRIALIEILARCP